MTDEEREEFKQLHRDVRQLRSEMNEVNVVLGATHTNLAAKERNLAAKQEAIEKLAAQATAHRVLLVAVQHTIAADPRLLAVLKKEVAASLQSHEDFFLFSKRSDEAIEAFKKSLDILLRPDLKPFEPL